MTERNTPVFPDDLRRATDYVDKIPGLTLAQIKSQIRLGGVTAYRIGGRWFISEADFNAWVLAGRNDFPKVGAK